GHTRRAPCEHVHRLGSLRINHMRTSRSLLLLCRSLVGPAHAGGYKCANEKGVVYQDTACAPGKELRNLDTDPATLSVVPGTPVPAAKSAAEPAAKPARVRTGTVKVKGGNPAERKFIQASMSEAEVIHKVGRPDVEAKGRGKQGHAWSD